MYDLLYTLMKAEEGYTELTVWAWTEEVRPSFATMLIKPSWTWDKIYLQTRMTSTQSLWTISANTSNHDFFSQVEMDFSVK